RAMPARATPPRCRAPPRWGARGSFWELTPIRPDTRDGDGSNAARKRRVPALFERGSFPDDGSVKRQDHDLGPRHAADRVAPALAVRLEEKDHFRIRSEREEENRPVGPVGVRRCVPINGRRQQTQLARLALDVFTRCESPRQLTNLNQAPLRGLL